MAVGTPNTQTKGPAPQIRGSQTHGVEAVEFDTHRSAPIKVFTDVSKRKQKIGVGIVIKNHNGKILHRKWCLLGNNHDVNTAEALALKAAMEYVDAEHVKFYTDCEEVATVLRSSVYLPVEKYDYFTIQCIDRDDNFAAHLLARKANPHVTV